MTRPFLDEVKRRKVFRVAVIYGAAAFAVLQAADLVLPRLGVSDRAMRVIVILALVGLPVSLVLGWVLELTPEGVRVTPSQPAHDTNPPPSLLGRRTILATAVLIAVGIAFATGLLVSPAMERDGALDVGDRSVAVLPFNDIGDSAGGDWFADGLTEEVLNRLARVPGLKVAGRTSSFHFKGRDDELGVIASRLGVRYILEGTVRRDGERLRVTTQLVSAADGLQLWSDAFDDRLDDVFAIQDSIAHEIAAALRIELGDAALANVPRATSMAAYEPYLEALTLIAHRGGGDAIAGAIALLERSVRADPRYAPAWGALAQAHALHRYYGGDIEESLVRAEAAAARALELDPALASAYTALGDVYRDRRRWSAAEQNYRHALELKPDDAEANSQYAQLLGRVGHLDRALPFARRAAGVEPVAALHQIVYGFFLFQTGQREAGLLQLERAAGLNPESVLGRQVHASMLIDLGRIEEAAALQRQLNEYSSTQGPPQPLSRLYERLQPRRDSAAVLAYLRSADEPSRHSGITHLHWAVHFGDPELALRLIQIEARASVWDANFAWSAGLSPVRRLPGFASLLQQFGIVDYWRQNGWPEVCSEAADGQITCR